MCTQASISQTASSRCLHQTEARYSNRAPLAPFLMMPYNPAPAAADAHCRFSLTWTDCCSLPLVLPASWMKCRWMSWMHHNIFRYFSPLSGLTIIFLLLQFLHPNSCGLVAATGLTSCLSIAAHCTFSFSRPSLTLEETSSHGLMITSSPHSLAPNYIQALASLK